MLKLTFDINEYLLPVNFRLTDSDGANNNLLHAICEMTYVKNPGIDFFENLSDTQSADPKEADYQKLVKIQKHLVNLFKDNDGNTYANQLNIFELFISLLDNYFKLVDLTGETADLIIETNETDKKRNDELTNELNNVALEVREICEKSVLGAMMFRSDLFQMGITFMVSENFLIPRYYSLFQILKTHANITEKPDIETVAEQYAASTGIAKKEALTFINRCISGAACSEQEFMDYCKIMKSGLSPNLVGNP